MKLMEEKSMLQVGMYVRCPIDDKPSYARTFYLGQITSIDEEQGLVTVFFHDPKKLRDFFSKLDESRTVPESWLVRVPALSDSSIVYNGSEAKLLSVSKTGDKESFYYYFVETKGKQVEEICESELVIPFTRSNINPASQMMRFELQNPQWYLNRRIVSKSLHSITNAPQGFKNLLGTRVQLFTHQVDTIVRALSESPCRLMLADEVGLGKTIEAMAIIKGMLDKQSKLNSLIIVPNTLLYQWQTEISFKFWYDAPIWNVNEIGNAQMLIVSFADIIKDYDKISKLRHWDVCVVDETHRLINNTQLYDRVLGLCKTTENILLLSATPILNREEEYCKLLTLLNPSRFEKMPADEFNNLLDKQKNIQDIVFDLRRDLPDYLEYDLSYDCMDGFEQINDEIHDERLAKLISQIDSNAEDKGLAQVKLILSYIAEFYQIERGIIRHRRAEIESANIKRSLIELPYVMSGSDVGFYEENAYNALLDLAIELPKETPEEIWVVKSLLSAISSSPYAVLEILEKNKTFLSKYYIDDVVSQVANWKIAYDSEIKNITQVTDDVDSFYSKFAKIVDYIDQEDVDCSNKYIIFTGFVSTAIKLEECFKNFFGEESTCSFHVGKKPEEMQDAATLFQNNEDCRFMICDESGGEGRNFQVADFIVSMDLPWSPALLEQRIGRLDRIGRECGKDVVSIVVHSESTVENALFNIYDEGLNIFNKSLCGMEIAFEDIHNAIEKALISDVKFGLSEAVSEVVSFSEKMNQEIEKERYYDLARQLDIDLQEKLGKLILQFTDNDGEELMNSMMSWPHMAGFVGIRVQNAFKDGSRVVSIDTTEISEKAMLQSLYFPPRMDEIVKRAKMKNSILGTFSRTAAVKHENLTFFAPYNPLFDSITSNAEECYRGRCTALRGSNCSIAWKGFVLVWNIKFNPVKLYENNISADLATRINRYLPSEQIIYTRGLLPKYEEIDKTLVLDEIDKLKWGKVFHLGKRAGGVVDSFRANFPPDKWRDLIKKVYNLGRKYAVENSKYSIDIERAKDELERLLTAQTAREYFYGYKDQKVALSQDEIDAIIYGLENPVYELDSIAYIELTM